MRGRGCTAWRDARPDRSCGAATAGRLNARSSPHLDVHKRHRRVRAGRVPVAGLHHARGAGRRERAARQDCGVGVGREGEKSRLLSGAASRQARVEQTPKTPFSDSPQPTHPLTLGHDLHEQQRRRQRRGVQDVRAERHDVRLPGELVLHRGPRLFGEDDLAAVRGLAAGWKKGGRVARGDESSSEAWGGREGGGGRQAEVPATRPSLTAHSPRLAPHLSCCTRSTAMPR